MTQLNSTEITVKIVAMSSRDIADLCEKQHKHVIRDIDKMLRDVLGDGPDLDHHGISTAYDARGYISEYRLPKDLTMTLITGYRADLRYKVIKRLEAMEVKLRLARAAPSAEGLVYGKWTLEEARERTNMLNALVRTQKAGPRAAAHIAAQLGFPATPAHLLDAPEAKAAPLPKTPKPPYGPRLPEEAAHYLKTRRPGDPKTIEDRDLLWRRQGRNRDGLIKVGGMWFDPDAQGWVWNKALGKWTRDGGRHYLDVARGGWDHVSKLGRRQ